MYVRKLANLPPRFEEGSQFLVRKEYVVLRTNIDNWLEGVINKTLVLMYLGSPQAKLYPKAIVPDPTTAGR